MEDSQLELVADIVSAYVENNSLPLAELPKLIADVSAALAGLNQPTPEPQPVLKPAVNPKKSVFPDYLVSLENGKQFKALRRHLAKLGMTPDEYRAKWGLAHDYPMVAASFAARRSELSKSLGLGRKTKVTPAEEASPEATEPEQVAPAKLKRGRKKPKAAS